MYCGNSNVQTILCCFDMTLLLQPATECFRLFPNVFEQHPDRQQHIHAAPILTRTNHSPLVYPTMLRWFAGEQHRLWSYWVVQSNNWWQTFQDTLCASINFSRCSSPANVQLKGRKNRRQSRLLERPSQSACYLLIAFHHVCQFAPPQSNHLPICLPSSRIAKNSGLIFHPNVLHSACSASSCSAIDDRTVFW